DDGVSYSNVAGSVVPDPKQSTSTVTITIDPVNDQPIFTMPNSTINLNEDPGSQTFTNFLTNVFAGPLANTPNGIGPADDELGNLPGVPGQSVTFAVRALDPTRFTSTGQPAILRTGTNGDFTFTLAPDVNSDNSGPILVEIIAQDGPPTVQSVARTVTINVAQTNDPPSFNLSASSLSIVEDAPRSVVPGLVVNPLPGPPTAIDESNQTFTTRIVAANPQYYTVQPRLTGTGDLEFQLAPDVNSLFAGSLNILITLTDNGTPNASLTKTLTITASDVNDAPAFNLSTTSVVVREDEESLTGNTPTSIPNFAANLTAGPATALDEIGQFAPTVPAQQLIFNVISVSNPTLFAANQTPSIDGVGTLHFVTAPDRNGTSIVVVRLTDNGRAGPPPNNNLGPTATFTITVNSVNDAPEFTLPNSTTAVEDQGVVSVPGFATGIRPGPATAIDETNQLLSFVVRAEDPGIFSVQPSIQNDGTLVFQTAPNINNNTSGIRRRVFVSLRDNGVGTPAPNQNLSAEQVFTLNITPVNDSPIPDVAVLQGVEDVPFDVSESTVLAGDLPGPADEVAALQTMRITQIERTTDRGGSVTPVFVGDRITSFRYSPPANFSGDDIIRYVVTDDGVPQASATGTITVQLAPINDPPQFIAGPDVTVNEDTTNYSQPWATGILAGPPNSQDENAGPNAQVVSFLIAVDNPALFATLPAINSAGILTFSLSKDAIGRAIVDVTAVDNGSSVLPNVNRSGTSKLTINVNPVNDPPGFVIIGDVAVDEDSSRYSAPAIRNIVPADGMNSVPATGVDEAGQSVSIFTSNNNTSLFAVQPVISPSGVLDFVPAQDAFGTAIVSVIARDSGPNTPPNVNESSPRTFTIVIRPTNDAPVAVNDRYNTDEDSQLTINAPGVLANDRDVDLPADALTVQTFQAISNLGATITVAANGQFTYDSRNAAQLQRLVNGETAQDTFSYTLRDVAGLDSNVATVTVTVSGLNDTPVAVNDTFSVPLGVSELLNVLANDRDIDSTIDPRTVEIGQLASNGTVTALATGRIEYRPNPGYRGPDSFTYRVRDALGALSNEARVDIVVNTSPVALPDSVLTGVNTPVVIDVLRNDSDPDGTLNRSSVSIVTGPDVGAATVLADGSIRYTPPTGFFGIANLQYAVQDDEGLSSNIANVSIRVTNSIHQNPVNNLDVNADGFVSPIDVLIVVNDLNFNGTRQLPNSLPTPPYLDVNGDRSVSPLDVLELINFINNRGNAGAGEGESSMANLGYSQGYVNMVPTEVVIRVTDEFKKQEQAAKQADAFVAEFNTSVYGPALPGPSDEDEDEDSETLRLIAQGNAEKSKDALDSIFADIDWS
ncbi:MAG: Ig-like domain-containing protein, partial [Pirellula sp.]